MKSIALRSVLLVSLGVGQWGCSSSSSNNPGQTGGTGGRVVVGAGGSAAGSGPSGGSATGGTTSGGQPSSAGGSSNGGTGPVAGAGPSGGAPAAGGAAPNGGGSSTGGTGATGGGIGTGEMPLVYDQENTGSACAKPPTPPEFSALTPIPNLPDPFLMTNGTRITTRDQWACRRAEISSLIQYWGSGPKGAPPSNLSATFANNKLTVVATQGSTSITLSSTITTPSGTGPFPLVIGMNTATGSLPSSLFSGVATMVFTDSQLVANDFNVTRGAGDYFKAYPDTNTGAMIEWAWGVSRLIDGLYKTADQNKIDLKHIAVTGCSFQGKMALYAGAFDERIALVIPEESGGGGEASWRFMATQTGTEDLEAAQGTAWYASNLLKFKNADAPKLPYDQHELVAMVAPRAILAVENTAIDRLGSQAGSVSMKAATEVYKALGIPDRIGFTQAAASAHCSFPSSQSADVTAFLDKFLRGKTTANTAIAKTNYNTDMSKWITWATPKLQ